MSNEQTTKTSKQDQDPKKKNYKIRRAIGAGIMAAGGLTAAIGVAETAASEMESSHLSYKLDKAAKEGKVGSFKGAEYVETPLTDQHLQEFADEAKEASSHAQSARTKILLGAPIVAIGAAVRKQNKDLAHDNSPNEPSLDELRSELLNQDGTPK